jgi:hypothetical protein
MWLIVSPVVIDQEPPMLERETEPPETLPIVAWYLVLAAATAFVPAAPGIAV